MRSSKTRRRSARDGRTDLHELTPPLEAGDQSSSTDEDALHCRLEVADSERVAGDSGSPGGVAASESWLRSASACATDSFLAGMAARASQSLTSKPTPEAIEEPGASSSVAPCPAECAAATYADSSASGTLHSGAEAALDASALKHIGGSDRCAGWPPPAELHAGSPPAVPISSPPIGVPVGE